MPSALILGLTGEVFFTGRDDGDFGPGAGPGGAGSPLQERQRTVVDRPWVTVRQVHGRRAVVVEDGVTDLGDTEADALVTTSRDVALAVKTADCAPVAFASTGGVVAVAHAGWRGLTDGVLAETVEAMRGLGATEIEAAVGPCIGPECYEFDDADLDVVAARLGDEVRATTGAGRPALDVRAAVRGALQALRVGLVFESSSCTACDGSGTRWFSHRARGEAQRQATVVWRT